MMRKRTLEMILQKLNDIRTPRPDLEQYRTPPGIVAEIVLFAVGNGSVVGKGVLELGCGSAPFLIAAGLLGAERLTGIEVDPESVKVALENIRNVDMVLGTDLKERVEIIEADISEVIVPGNFDTIFMNPPFGAQKRGADRPFLDTAMRTGGEIYSLHNASGIDFVRASYMAGGYAISTELEYRFPIAHRFAFHSKPSEDVPVIFLHAKGVSPRA